MLGPYSVEARLVVKEFLWETLVNWYRHRTTPVIRERDLVDIARHVDLHKDKEDTISILLEQLRVLEESGLIEKSTNEWLLTNKGDEFMWERRTKQPVIVGDGIVWDTPR